MAFHGPAGPLGLTPLARGTACRRQRVNPRTVAPGSLTRGIRTRLAGRRAGRVVADHPRREQTRFRAHRLGQGLRERTRSTSEVRGTTRTQGTWTGTRPTGQPRGNSHTDAGIKTHGRRQDSDRHPGRTVVRVPPSPSTPTLTLRAALAEGPVTFYCGFDPTAPEPPPRPHSVAVKVMRHLQLAGHHPLASGGGATGLIGDPAPGAPSPNTKDVVASWARSLHGPS